MLPPATVGPGEMSTEAEFAKKYDHRVVSLDGTLGGAPPLPPGPAEFDETVSVDAGSDTGRQDFTIDRTGANENFDPCALDQWVKGEWEWTPKFKQHTFTITAATDCARDTCGKSPVFLPTGRRQYAFLSKDDLSLCMAGKRILVIGDSHMRRTYTGIVDIITGAYDNVEMQKKIKHIDKKSGKVTWVVDDVGLIQSLARSSRSSGTQVDYLKAKALYFSATELIRSAKSKLAKYDVVFLHMLTHDINKRRVEFVWGTLMRGKGAMTPAQAKAVRRRTFVDYMKNLATVVKALKEANVPVVWATGGAYVSDRIPDEFRDNMKNTIHFQLNVESVDYLRSQGIPFVDTYHLTSGCLWSNCTIDGSHKSRFVERMKAQILMNYLCKPAGTCGIKT